MPFQQLYYTSCATGLSGFAGFQFNAATPGISPVMMREVEQLTVYEPPRHMNADPDPAELSSYPVNLLHTFSETTDAPIIARTVFTGRDFSHRPGNYFAHTLVTESPDDLADALPIELWESRVWQARPVPDQRLPPISGPPPRGPLSRESVVASLGAAADERVLAMMLSAVHQSMTGRGRPVLLIGPDSARVAHWIAAVSYLLGTRLARDLTFSTYNHRPDYCRTHVIGTVGLTGEYAAVGASPFQIFDLVAGEFAEATVDPAAALLARAGVVEAEALWRQAAELAGERDRSFAGWFPPLAGAAMVRNMPLTEVELDAVVGWLSDASADAPVTARIAEMVTAALGQPIDRLDPRRQRQLVEIAPSTDQVAEIEMLLVRSAFRRLADDEPPGGVIRLVGADSRALATAECEARVADTDPARALALLAWAAAAGVSLPDDRLHRCGSSTIAPELLAGRRPPQLDAAMRAWPALRDGVVQAVSLAGPRRQRDALRVLASLPFTDEDFADHPDLAAEWTIESVRLGRMPPVTGLTRVREARRIDDALLRRLWPGGGWSPEEAHRLVQTLPAPDFRQGALHDWLLAVVHKPPLHASDDAWMALLRDLTTATPHPLPPSEHEDTRKMLEVAQRLTRIQAGRRSTPTPEEYAQLYSDYETGGSSIQMVLTRKLPAVIRSSHPFDTTLDKCPQPIFDALCRYIAERLTDTAEVNLAAWTYAVMRRLYDNRSEGRAKRLEKEVLLPAVIGWRGRTLQETAREIDKYATNTGTNFKLWHRTNRPGVGGMYWRTGNRLRRR